MSLVVCPQCKTRVSDFLGECFVCGTKLNNARPAEQPARKIPAPAGQPLVPVSSARNEQAPRVTGSALADAPRPDLIKADMTKADKAGVRPKEKKASAYNVISIIALILSILSIILIGVGAFLYFNSSLEAEAEEVEEDYMDEEDYTDEESTEDTPDEEISEEATEEEPSESDTDETLNSDYLNAVRPELTTNFGSDFDINMNETAKSASVSVWVASLAPLSASSVSDDSATPSSNSSSGSSDAPSGDIYQSAATLAYDSLFSSGLGDWHATLSVLGKDDNTILLYYLDGEMVYDADGYYDALDEDAEEEPEEETEEEPVDDTANTTTVRNNSSAIDESEDIEEEDEGDIDNPEDDPGDDESDIDDPEDDPGDDEGDIDDPEDDPGDDGDGGDNDNE